MEEIKKIKEAKSLEEAIKLGASFLAKTLDVEEKEVAILLLDENGEFLKFYHPPELKDAGAIPVKSYDAVAVKVLHSKHPSLFNDFQRVRHLSIFERVKGPDGKEPLPIQKLMAVPICTGEECLGVAEVSRMGKTPEEAGPDFENSDLMLVEDFCKFFATVIKKFLKKGDK